MLATLTSADSGSSQLSLRDSGAVPCFARHCQTTSGSANEVSWEGIKSGGRACQRRDRISELTSPPVSKGLAS